MTPRDMWMRYETVHAVTYFAPEGRSAYEEAGLRGFWRGYFAGRAAPLGPVDAAPVTALFFSFAPSMVARALPDVWTRIAPAQALRARRDGATAALRALLPDGANGLAEAADLAEAAADATDCAGRALGAANAALPAVPDAEPLTRLWQAATTLREHRGDGHVAALVAAGFDGCEAVMLRSALDGQPAEYRPPRGWDEEHWAATQAGLVDRGWLDDAGQVTAEGRRVYAGVEDVTDRIAAAPWRELGVARTQRLAELIQPIADAASAVLPYPNPVGIPPLR